MEAETIQKKAFSSPTTDYSDAGPDPTGSSVLSDFEETSALSCVVEVRLVGGLSSVAFDACSLRSSVPFSTTRPVA